MNKSLTLGFALFLAVTLAFAQIAISETFSIYGGVEIKSKIVDSTGNTWFHYLHFRLRRP